MKLKHSLAYQLLKVTFSFYLLITVSITVLHMYAVWIQAEKYLNADLMKLGNSAQQGIVLALWDLDYVQVDLIVEGLLELPIVVGIEVKERKINKLYGEQGNIAIRYQLIHEEEPGVTYEIGDMTMYSSSSIVFNRVKNEYILTVINAIIKTFALWIIVLLAGKKLITKPLALLTEANKSVDLENIETFKEVNIGIAKSDNELVFLEESFNKMVQRLAIDRQELDRINQDLEFMVEQRTRELRETNETLNQEMKVRKHTEEEFKIAKEQAVNANQAKSEFLSNMSHELRTPLNAILGFAQLVAHNPNIPPEVHDNLGIIQSSGEHLLTLINQVLNLSKIETGRIALNEDKFDLHRLLNDVHDMFAFNANKKNLQLLFERDANVPRNVSTDEGKLRQVLINLISNAIKFTEAGGVTVKVKGEKCQVKSEESESTFHSSFFILHLSVADTGPGIAPEEIDHVFEAFGQTATGRQALEGTGLGLVISYKFVQLMGGDMHVTSAVGQGTTLSFDIRVQVVDTADITPRIPTRRVIELEPGQPRYRILVVDDKWDNRQLLIKLLNPFGFDLREAENGQEAIDIWETWEPHLIWMDMRMPVMDGYEATKRIRKLDTGTEHPSSGIRHPVIIAVTASSFEEERSVVLSAGCDDIVIKPYRETDIVEMLQRHLNVKFLYAADEIPAENADLKDDKLRLNPSDFHALPKEMVMKFKTSVEALEMDMALNVIEEIGEQNKPLADALKKIVEEYRFDTLQELLDQV